MKVLNNIAEPFRTILGGVATNLIEIERYLRIIPLTKEQELNCQYGFRLMRRSVEMMWFDIDDNIICGHYSMHTRKYNGGGYWQVDVQNPIAFNEWYKWCESHILLRIVGLIEEQIKRNKPKLERLRCRISYREWKIAYEERVIKEVETYRT